MFGGISLLDCFVGSLPIQNWAVSTIVIGHTLIGGHMALISLGYTLYMNCMGFFLLLITHTYILCNSENRMTLKLPPLLHQKCT